MHAYRGIDRKALFCILAGALASTSVALAQTPPAGKVIEETVHSASLESNLLGDSPDRSVTVYLPPSYARSSNPYPVVYLLSGFGDSDKQWLEKKWVNVPEVMDELIAAGKIREMIVVMPDTKNKLGGSFHTNSVTSGNWEDFIVRDLVKYVDAKYRTVSRAGSRGIAGHSSGGYGAIKLAMKHPDAFGAVYALSACCLDWDDLWSAASPAWPKALTYKSMNDLVAARKALHGGNHKDPNRVFTFVSLASPALAAAWSPNPQRAPFFGDLPVEVHGGAPVFVETVREAWVANLPVPMLGQYRSNLAQLRGIAFDVGTQDWNQGLIKQARELDEALTRNGIHHEFEQFEGSHSDKTRLRMETRTLPFFSRVLE